MRGAAMKAGPGALDGRVSRARRGPVRVPPGAPGVAARQRPGRSAGSRCARCSRASGATSPERVLAEIDPEPAAAASIGQVYRGRTDDGRDVAIKVQYPGIAEAVESDMRNLRLLSPLLRQLMPGLEVKDAARRAARADRRGMRLRARGGQPPPARALLARPSVRPRPGRRHRAQPPPRARHRLGRRDATSTTVAERAGRGPRPLRRDRLPLLLRDRRARTSRSATRTPATTCSAPTAASPSSTSA